MHESPHGLLFTPQFLQQPEEGGGGGTVGTRVGEGGTSVGIGTAVAVGNLVGTRVGTDVGASVDIGTGVLVNFNVGVKVCVGTRVLVGSGVSASLGVLVGTRVVVGNGTFVRVAVAIAGVTAGVEVDVGPHPTSTATNRSVNSPDGFGFMLESSFFAMTKSAFTTTGRSACRRSAGPRC